MNKKCFFLFRCLNFCIFFGIVILAVSFFDDTTYATECTGGTVTLAWDANSESNLGGYKLYYDIDSSGAPYAPLASYHLDQGAAPITIPITSLPDLQRPEYTLSGLRLGYDYYFAVTAYDTESPVQESGYSNEVTCYTQGQAIETNNKKIPVSVLIYSWLGDSVDGSVPATPGNAPIDGYVFLVTTNPGAVAPTEGYDVTLTDTDGMDIMGGELADRSASASEQAVPKINDAYISRYVSGTITLNITNNSALGAKGKVSIFFKNNNGVRP